MALYLIPELIGSGQKKGNKIRTMRIKVLQRRQWSAEVNPIEFIYYYLDISCCYQWNADNFAIIIIIIINFSSIWNSILLIDIQFIVVGLLRNAAPATPAACRISLRLSAISASQSVSRMPIKRNAQSLRFMLMSWSASTPLSVATN